MNVAERWAGNVEAVGVPGAMRADLECSRGERRALARSIRELPAGATVIVSAAAPGAIGRCRSFAAWAGIEVEREYLAFPSARAPAFLVEDAPASVGHFVRTVLVPPPGSGFADLIDGVMSLLRRLRAWSLVRIVAPGRVVVGRRR